MNDQADLQAKSNRQSRYMSHALVEIRRFRHLPFGVHSAVLLDISLGGFKVEFTSEVVLNAGAKFWLSIPLSPLGIQAPARLFCSGECRWFDDKKFRVGGVFSDLSKGDRHILDRVVDTLNKSGSLTNARPVTQEI